MCGAVSAVVDGAGDGRAAAVLATPCRSRVGREAEFGMGVLSVSDFAGGGDELLCGALYGSLSIGGVGHGERRER